ncbi:MFS transporter [uncultured Clostridium sp.]|uniref:MFS transporter n=1 Tax=uncultured Clostridium sp. TaxID=59620 RepID=UPI0025E23911|nr:MFS transporter [uncultured Clostridium sp.]
MKSKINYSNTIRACFVGYIVQAVVNNYLPLLLLTFNKFYHITLAELTLLVSINFIVQLITDSLSVLFIDKIGYRLSMIIAHILAMIGLVLLAISPNIVDDSFPIMLFSVVIYAIGGGLLEVLVSPIVEACPTERKELVMSTLHSFYCWGQVGVVFFSTIYFKIFGVENWTFLTLIWAILPLANAIAFMKVPIMPLIPEGEEQKKAKELITSKEFFQMIVLMICAGASEQSVSQWASTFAEASLGISKTIGDLAGPMFFALCMGISRFFYGKYGTKIKLEKFMLFSIVMCIFSYCMISFTHYAPLGLLGCGLCGLSVGILWPGTFSLASSKIRNGGTLMYALLALAGDLGCMAGPMLVGSITNNVGGDIKRGIAVATIFPIIMLISNIRASKS